MLTYLGHILKLVWDAIVHSQTAKTTIAVSASSTVAFTAIIANVEKKFEEKIDRTNMDMVRYVDFKNDIGLKNIELVYKDVSHIKSQQDDIKDLLKTINARIYELNQKREK